VAETAATDALLVGDVVAEAMVPAALPDGPTPWEGWAERVDGALRLAWLLSTTVLLVGLAASAVGLGRRLRRWPLHRVDGSPVRVGPLPGPAVVGIRHPEIVVPRWVLDLPAGDRQLILAHERSHLEARDPLLMCAAWILAACMPWNPALWIQVRRLRAAMEEDCDRRVIRHRSWPDARRYGELLVDVGSRLGAGSPLLAPAGFAEGGSHLERRIRAMYNLFPPLSRLRMILGVAGAVGLAAAVAVFPRPDRTALTGADRADASAPADQVDASEAFTPFTTPPRLLNGAEVRAALDRGYPPLLRDAGIGGTVEVWIYVDASGRATDTRIDVTSGHGALDGAALDVVAMMRFRAARNGDVPVAAWVSLPMTFGGGDADATPPPPGVERIQIPEPELDRPDNRGERPSAAAGPTFTPYTVAPNLVNRPEIGEALAAEYPPLLRDAGIGGTARVWFFIDEEGRVEVTRLDQSSGHEALDAAALAVAARMRFSPALNRDEPVPVWVAFPITYQVR
jgi:TonB family protein